MRLLHLADVHIGARFVSLGEEKAREQREQLLVTLENACRLGIERKVRAVLVAGDLFDRSVVGAAPLARVSRSLELLGSANIPVVIMPGTHDREIEGGVWETWSPPPNVTVLRAASPSILLDDLDLAIHGVIGGGARLRDELAALPGAPRLRFNVAMIHGSLPMPGLTDDSGEEAIDPRAIEACGMDYVALGHWHGAAVRKFGGVTAAYPGSPEPIAFDQRDAGHVLLVELDKGAVNVEPVRVGRRTFEVLAIDVAQMRSAESLARAIEERSGPDTGLEVRLTGVKPASLDLDTEELQAELSPRFFRLRIVDASHPGLDAVDLSNYPEGTVIGRFVRGLEADAAQADGAAREEIADAMALGVALLEGREVPL